MQSQRKKALILSVSILFALSTTAIKPKTESASAETGEKSAFCVMEATTRRILYAERGDVRLPMASTTKILTAATVLDELPNLDETVTIPQEAVGIEGSSLYLKAGDQYTVRDLTYGLMLRSGNDAAIALALHTAGSIEKFCSKMNETAQKAGALHSRFVNPHGLPNKNHYTTAIDLSLITCYALQNPVFCEIAATKYYEPHAWQNKNKLLFDYEGAIGVKTGYTKEAGRCLVSAAEKENMRLVCTVLNCYDHYQKTKNLLNSCFSTYKFHEITSTKDVFCLKIGQKEVKARLQKDIRYPLSDGEAEHISMQTVAYLEEKKDKSVGEIHICLAKRLLFCEKLYKL